MDSAFGEFALLQPRPRGPLPPKLREVFYKATSEEPCKRVLLSILGAALAIAGMVSVSHAGVIEAHFRVTLTILPPQPAPKISQLTVTPTSPGYPAYPVFQSQGPAGESAGPAIIVLKTVF